MTYNVCRAHYTHVVHHHPLCDVPVVQWVERSLKRVDFISRVRIPLELLHLSQFKPLFTRCIPTLQVSCLDNVVDTVFDSGTFYPGFESSHQRF